MDYCIDTIPLNSVFIAFPTTILKPLVSRQILHVINNVFLTLYGYYIVVLIGSFNNR